MLSGKLLLRCCSSSATPASGLFHTVATVAEHACRVAVSLMLTGVKGQDCIVATAVSRTTCYEAAPSLLLRLPASGIHPKTGTHPLSIAAAGSVMRRTERARVRALLW